MQRPSEPKTVGVPKLALLQPQTAPKAARRRGARPTRRHLDAMASAANVTPLTNLATILDGRTAGVASSPKGHAANDAAHDHERGPWDVNHLICQLAERLSTHARQTARLELRLSGGMPPMLEGSATAAAFAIAGVLSVLLRAVDEPGQGRIRVETQAGPRSVRVTLLADGVPPLPTVRAVAGTHGTDADPTMVHCRRLVRGLGGDMELADHDGLLGFRLELPASPSEGSVTAPRPRRLRSSFAHTPYRVAA